VAAALVFDVEAHKVAAGGGGLDAASACFDSDDDFEVNDGFEVDDGFDSDDGLEEDDDFEVDVARFVRWSDK
jgi:hypothetical protein